MVTIPALWLPILLSAVAVFLASSVINMFLPYHRTDFGRLPNEDEVMAALRRGQVAPGDYAVPFAASPQDMKEPAYLERVKEGPVAFLTVAPPGGPSMGRALVFWLLFTLAVSTVAAYVGGRALPPGADYLDAFRFAGTTAFVAYSFGLYQQSIWYARRWSTTLKFTFDGLIYALITAGMFGWLWP